MKLSTKILLISVMMCVSTGSMTSCSLIHPSTRQKAMADERQNEKAAGKELKEREKAHYKAQPADTRKMMKKSRKAAKKLNKYKKI